MPKKLLTIPRWPIVYVGLFAATSSLVAGGGHLSAHWYFEDRSCSLKDRGVMTTAHPILDENGFEAAVEYVRSYFHDKRASGRKAWTGAHFDTWPTGGEATASELTGNDFVAVSMLSVTVPAKAVVGLHEKAAEVRQLLEALPLHVDFTELTRDEFDHYLGSDGPGQKLWDLLRSHADPWGVGPTTASKIMARKRPALIPIYDSEVGPQMGLPHSGQQWERWFEAFQNDPGLADRLDRIGAAADVPFVSRLRVMDVALWRYAKLNGLSPLNDREAGRN